jgi:hypothetical protein
VRPLAESIDASLFSVFLVPRREMGVPADREGPGAGVGGGKGVATSKSDLVAVFVRASLADVGYMAKFERGVEIAEAGGGNLAFGSAAGDLRAADRGMKLAGLWAACSHARGQRRRAKGWQWPGRGSPNVFECARSTATTPRHWSCAAAAGDLVVRRTAPMQEHYA